MQAVSPEPRTAATARHIAWARRAAPWVILLLVSVGAGLYGRYGLIESTPIGLMCQGGDGSGTDPAWYCGPRTWLIQFNLWNGWSWAAIAGGLAAILFGWRAGIMLGIVAGGCGLVLYNAGPAGFGLLLALMRLVRR